MLINAFSDLSESQQTKRRKEIESIFFEAAAMKKFRDEVHRKNFFKRWCGVYLELFPQQFLLAIKEDRLLGYLSYNATSPLGGELSQPGVEEFRDLYDKYPAHLHINCHADARGQGVGGALLNALEKRLQDFGVCGVHILTTEDQKNVGFYRKYGFNREVKRSYEGYELLFMGKKISRPRGERET